ncbi:MAG: transcription termination factor Rho [Planctomycetia bacterium TMED53]|nr:MAG: transcription termination factor Rho [Planctomycetia bacterium TMED53]
MNQDSSQNSSSRSGGSGRRRRPSRGRGRPSGGDNPRSSGRRRNGGQARKSHGRSRREVSHEGGGNFGAPRGKPVHIPEGTRVRGILEVGNQGFGFLRSVDKSFRIQPEDVHVGKNLVQKFGLRTGHYMVGVVGGSAGRGRGPSLGKIESVDGDPPELVRKRTPYKEMTSIDPSERFLLGQTGDISMRLADLISPIGKGQRALIVAPPRTGKTVLLQKMAQSITETHPDSMVVALLVDERPEEVTDWKRSVKAEVYASSSDETSKSHVRVSEIVLQRCHRLLEAKCDVVLLMDSLTRLGRAYNLETAHSGRTLSGGVDAKTLEKPKAIFGAARNVEGGGSLTIIATALIETGSRMDEVIFEEFKGTGNMELVLSRKLADQRVFPAIDVTLSGTRKEEKLYTPEEIDQIWKLRRVLTSVNPVEGMELLSQRVGAFQDNKEFLHSLGG